MWIKGCGVVAFFFVHVLVVLRVRMALRVTLLGTYCVKHRARCTGNYKGPRGSAPLPRASPCPHSVLIEPWGVCAGAVLMVKALMLLKERRPIPTQWEVAELHEGDPTG